MNDQENSFDLELKEVEQQEKEAAANLQTMRKRKQDLLEQQERRLNDPKERAKMFKTANEMFDEGVKEYQSKGYFCDVQRDENGLITKILIKSKKSGNRIPRKKAGELGFIPAMTSETFAEIYNALGEEFNNKDIITALAGKNSDGCTNFRTQPVLGKILSNGYNNIRFSKIGVKGRGVKYKKIL